MMYRYEKVLFLCIVLLFGSTWLFAQGPDTLWTRTYGGADWDYGAAAQQTLDGGYIFAGHTYSYGAGSYDFYLIKLDSNGDTVWTRTYGGTEREYCYSLQQTTDKGYIIAGSTNSFGAGLDDVYLVKTDSLGDTLWTRTYGGIQGDLAYSVQQTLDDGYVISGYTWSFGAGGRDVYLIKTDSLGDTLWTKTYGQATYEAGWSVQQTNDKGFIITGDCAYDVYLIKTDSLGDTLWTKKHGWIDDDEGRSVQQTTDGGYIITGYSASYSAGDDDVYLIKTDSLGDTLWTKTYGDTNTEYGRSVQQTDDGGYIITGYTRSIGAGADDVYLLKTDSLGDTLWTKTYGGTNTDYGRSVQQTTDGGYIVAGYTNSFGAGRADFYLIKTDTDPIGIEEYHITGCHTSCLEVSPNPFNKHVHITLYKEYKNLPASSDGGGRTCRLCIYNVSGQTIKQFNNRVIHPSNQIIWDGRDDCGKLLPSGVYFLFFKMGTCQETRKILFIR